MSQTQPLGPLYPSTVSSGCTHGGPPVYPPAPIRGGGCGTGGPAQIGEHCNQIESFTLAELNAKYADRPPLLGYDKSRACLTFEELVALEPQLGVLQRAAQTHHRNPDPKFCANAIWYGYFGFPGIRSRLLWLVGWERPGERHAVLSSPEAYDVAYEAIYDALPDCRDCACGGW